MEESSWKATLWDCYDDGVHRLKISLLAIATLAKCWNQQCFDWNETCIDHRWHHDVTSL